MVQVLMVTKAGCKPCRRVKDLLEALRGEVPALEVREVDFTSERGMALAVEHGILYPPALFINGKFLAYGKIHAEPLRRAVLGQVASSAPE